MNPALGKLHPYPFERLSALLAADQPTQPLIDLSIGEPRHPAPEFVLSALRAELAAIANYPNTRGETGLREACAAWLNRRAGLAADAAIDPATQVLPVNGTREALFAIAHCLIDTRRQRPTVVLPNPFYQIYEGATLLAQAEPYYMPCPAEHGHQPNIASVPASVWERCQLVYICTPGNPSGAVMPEDSLRLLLTLAERHDFIIVSDECYGEIYLDEASPPPGLLQVAAASGNPGLERCISFHSLSKRSNVPGLRSGFVAGSQTLIERFALYRTYHGCAMPLHHQRASALAWADEEHVRDNRARYREKFAAVAPILAAVFPVEVPAAGFYLWPATGMDDLEFCQRCYRDAGVKVLPGTFLARTVNGSNPGEARARLALVASLEQCIEAATRIQNCLSQR
jgi:N-succinyldiaminopimelate aminotransferase